MDQLLKEICPSVETFGVFETNLANKESQLLIVVNGKKFTLSDDLTKLVRSKKVSFNNLGDYLVRDVIGKDGTAFQSLGLRGEKLVSGVEWSNSNVSADKPLTVQELQVVYCY